MWLLLLHFVARCSARAATTVWPAILLRLYFRNRGLALRRLHAGRARRAGVGGCCRCSEDPRAPADARLASQRVWWSLVTDRLRPFSGASHRRRDAEATTCRGPGSVDCPRFIFVAVNGPSESSQRGHPRFAILFRDDWLLGGKRL